MPPKSIPWKEFLVNNWGLKLLAVIMGSLAFYAIREATSFEIPYEVPVEVKAEKGIAILDQDPRVVEVTFRGAQEDIRKIMHQKLKITVQPRTGSPEGSERLTLRPGQVENVPAGVRAVSIRPKEVMLRFDSETEKKVSVARPKTLGAPLVGRVEVDYEPRMVMLRGPRQRLADKTVLDTEPVDVDGRVESFTRRVRVIPPRDAPGLKIEPNEVEVRISIVTESATRVWSNVLVKALSPPGQGWVPRCQPERVEVQVHGRKELIQRVEEHVISTFVDSSKLALQVPQMLPVHVFLPPGMDLNATVIPDQVRVVLEPPPVPEPAKQDVSNGP